MNIVPPVNKSQQLYEILKTEIIKGRYKKGERLPSMRELSYKYGLSINTVNKSIAILVSEGIATIVDGVGAFVVNHEKKPGNIGVMIFDFARSFRVDTDLLNSIQLHLPEDYFLSLVDTGNNVEVFIQGLERLRSMNVKGIIAVPPKVEKYTEKQKERIRKIVSETPLVFAIREIPDIDADFLSADISTGLSQAFAYLNSVGRKNAAIVMHDHPKFIREEQQALEKVKGLSLEVSSNNILQYSDEDNLIESLSTRLKFIDALIAPDQIVYKLQNIINQQGIRIPEDLSIVSINNTLYSKIFMPPLTTVAFPVDKLGKKIVKTLIERIEMPFVGGIKKENLPTYLILRNS